MTFEPLKITAWMQTPVITDAWLPIDAIVYYHAMADQNGPQIATMAGAHNAPTGDQQSYMPFRRCGLDWQSWRYADGAPLYCDHPAYRVRNRDVRWYYAASFAQWGPHVDGMDHWNKRFDVAHADLIDFGTKRGNVIVEQGQYKAYHMPVYYRSALWVSWYVVGDREELHRLMPHITNLGKKAAQGWGAVLRWEIVPWPHDWSVYGPDGAVMRAVPAQDGILTGFRPSYWLPKNQSHCLVPDSHSLKLEE